jgi:hypothetical protein
MANSPLRVVRPSPALGDEARQRVLRRALDLAESAEPVDADDDAVLTAAAAELGVDAKFVGQALAEERAGLLAPTSATFLDRLAGPGIAVATMRVERDAPLAAVGLWLERAHCLRRVQADAEHGVWVRRSDLVASARRAVAGVAGSGGLGDRREVRASATPAGDGHWLVRLEADVRHRRVLHVGAGAAMSGTGLSLVALGASGALVLVPAALVGAPTAVGGLLLVSSNRNRVRRVEHELLRVLDAVARGQAPLGPLDAVTSLLGRRR